MVRKPLLEKNSNPADGQDWRARLASAHNNNSDWDQVLKIAFRVNRVHGSSAPLGPLFGFRVQDEISPEMDTQASTLRIDKARRETQYLFRWLLRPVATKIEGSASISRTVSFCPTVSSLQ